METTPKSVLRSPSRGRGRTRGLGRGAGIDADPTAAGPVEPDRAQSAETSHGQMSGGNTHGRGRNGHENYVQNRRRARSMPHSKNAARKWEQRQSFLPDRRESTSFNSHETAVPMMSLNHLPSTQSGISNSTQSFKPPSTNQPELTERTFHLPQDDPTSLKAGGQSTSWGMGEEMAMPPYVYPTQSQINYSNFDHYHHGGMGPMMGMPFRYDTWQQMNLQGDMMPPVSPPIGGWQHQ